MRRIAPAATLFTYATTVFAGQEWRIAKTHRIGQQIRAAELRVIDAENNQLGVLPTTQALEMADEKELDLVEVSPNAEPPVARIMDFGKFKYEQERAAKKQKKSRAGQVKEIRLSMKIGAHDLEYRMAKAKVFLAEGQKVKFNLMMKGRENANPKAAMEKLLEFIRTIPFVKVESGPSRAGRSISAVGVHDKKAETAAIKEAREPESGKQAATKAATPEAAPTES